MTYGSNSEIPIMTYGSNSMIQIMTYGSNTPATKWCVDCEDALCINCVKAHRGSRVSMTHHVIGIEVISTLPGEVLTTQEKCSRHPDFIMNFFCNQHHVICCQNCMRLNSGMRKMTCDSNSAEIQIMT
jgi:hypothetical protein